MFSYGAFSYNIKYNDCNTIVETSTTDYLNNKLPNGNYIEKGIEYNKKDQEVAIFICPTSFGEPYVRIPFKNSNGFTQVQHGFISKEPGQKRGLPDSAYSWHEWMNIRDLARFEMESARINSTISGTVTADSNAQPGGQQGGLEYLGKPAGWGGINTISTGVSNF